jgi:hypothetical protein
MWFAVTITLLFLLCWSPVAVYFALLPCKPTPQPEPRQPLARTPRPLFCGRSGQNLRQSGESGCFARRRFCCYCSSTSEAGRVSSCRGETPRTPPRFDRSPPPARKTLRTRLPELASATKRVFRSGVVGGRPPRP